MGIELMRRMPWLRLAQNKQRPRSYLTEVDIVDLTWWLRARQEPIDNDRRFAQWRFKRAKLGLE